MSFPPVRSMKKIIKKEKRFDIIHTHSPFCQGWYAMFYRKLLKCPMVTTFHTHLPEYVGHLLMGLFEEKVKRVLYEPTWQIVRQQYNQYDAILTPSKMMRRELEQHGVKPVIDVPNSISPLFFQTEEAIRKKRAIAFRKRFNIPVDAKLLMYVGRIAFEKRLEVLLKAFKTLHERYDNLYLAIVGDGPQLGMYKNKARKLELKDYVFTGYVHHRQLAGVYSAGDIFISPSDTETQGLTFIESMSQGTPVIGVNSRGIADYVKNNQNGLLTQTLKPDEFVKLISYSLDNPEKLQTIIKNGHETAKNYTYFGFKKRLMEAYSLGIKEWERKGNK